MFVYMLVQYSFVMRMYARRTMASMVNESRGQFLVDWRFVMKEDERASLQKKLREATR